MPAVQIDPLVPSGSGAGHGDPPPVLIAVTPVLTQTEEDSVAVSVEDPALLRINAGLHQYKYGYLVSEPRRKVFIIHNQTVTAP